MKYLIAGLGNIGDEYDGTRHNIGFRVLDALAKASNTAFEDRRYGFVAHMRVKNAELVLLKPSTYMNLIGNVCPRGAQVDFVLSGFNAEDEAKVNEKVPVAVEAIKAFALSGIQFAMCNYNGK